MLSADVLVGEGGRGRGGWGRRGNNCRNPARGDRNLNENDWRSEEKEMGSRNFRDRMSLVLPKQFTLDQ